MERTIVVIVLWWGFDQPECGKGSTPSPAQETGYTGWHFQPPSGVALYDPLVLLFPWRHLSQLIGQWGCPCCSPQRGKQNTEAEVGPDRERSGSLHGQSGFCPLNAVLPYIPWSFATHCNLRNMVISILVHSEKSGFQVELKLGIWDCHQLKVFIFLLPKPQNCQSLY